MVRNLILAGLLVGTIGHEAFADRRTNGLEKDVAVRHRRLLVAKRFEATPLFESSGNADFQHIVGGGLKLEYHFSDKLSSGVIGVASPALHTSLVDEVVHTLPATPPMVGRDPRTAQGLYHL